MGTGLRAPCQALGMHCGRTCLGVPVNLAKRQPAYAMIAQSTLSNLEVGDINGAFGMVRSLGEYARNEKLEQSYHLTADALLGHVMLAQGFPEEAADIGHKVAATAKVMPLVFQEQLLEGIFVWALACYDLQQLDEFNEVAHMFRDFSPLDCRCYRDLRLVVLDGLMALSSGQRGVALEKFGQLDQYEHVSQYWAQVGRLAQCECALEMGDLDSAVAFLQRADPLFSHSVTLGALQIWLPRLPNTAKLVLREFSYWPTVTMPHAALAPVFSRKRPDAALHIDAFGRARVLSHGKDVKFEEEKYQQALALLTYLAMNPGGVEIDRVMLDLWPAAKAKPDGRPSYSSFNKARAFAVEACEGFDHVLVAKGVASVPEDAWVDAVAFEHAFDQAAKVPLGNALSRLEYARSLYKGTFLLGGKLLWVAERMRHYQEMAAWVSLKIAAIYASAAQGPNGTEGPQLQQALKYLKEALELDPIFDQAMVEMVRTMDQLGMRSAAHVTLDNYIKRLRAIFRGAPPAAQILTLKERFMHEPDQLTMPFTRIELVQAARRPAVTIAPERAESIQELRETEGLAALLHLNPISVEEAARASWEDSTPRTPPTPHPARKRPADSFLQEP